MELTAENIFKIISKNDKNWFRMDIHILKNKEEYLKELYLTSLIMVASVDGNFRDEEIKYLSEMIKGINMKNDLSEYINKSFTFTKENFDEFAKLISKEELRYAFILDSMILARIDGKLSDEEIKIISMLGETLNIQRQEMKSLSEITRIILKDNFNDFAEFKEKYGSFFNLNIFEHAVKFRNIDFVTVEKGSFQMGGTNYDAEKPVHQVTFTYDFYAAKYLTTFEEYDKYCDETGLDKPSDKGWGRSKRPVIYVSWWNAIEYCNYLSDKEGLMRAYDNNGNLIDIDGKITTDPSKVEGYRLPTEAEWEYSARGGNKSKGYEYSGSNSIGDVAWYSSNAGGKTQEVGLKKPNELGIYDMSGNVWEWCNDWYGSYSNGNQINPYNSVTGSNRVFRGGCCYSNDSNERVTYRSNYTPTNSSDFIGFRIFRTLK